MTTATGKRNANSKGRTQASRGASRSSAAKSKLREVNMLGQIEAINKVMAMIEFDLDGTIITANENFLQAVEYSLDEIQGNHHRIFVDPAYAQSDEYRAFWAKLNRGEFVSDEFKRFGKGGKEVWLQASYNPIFDEQGKPFKVVKYATDVTAEKQKNANFIGQLDAINKAQAVIEFQMDGTILHANENFCQTMGYTLDEIKGKHHRIFAEAEYAQSDAYREFWAKLNRGEYQSAEYKRLGKGGRVVWIQASYNPIMDVNGKPFKVVKYATDVTDQKQAARRAQSMLSMIEEAATNFMTCDKDLVITYCNPAILDMFRRHENEIRRVFPSFDVNKLVGSSIDIFHKDPEHQRRALTDLSNLPMRSELKIGSLEFGVNATALRDTDGNYMGNGVEWVDQNERVKYREEVNKVIQASENGDLKVRGDLDRLDDVYRPMMAGINEIIDAVVRPVNEASEVLEKIAAADLTARMVGDYRGDYAKIKNNLNTAGQSLQDALLAVADSAGQVGSASAQITEGAQKVAEGASAQASSIEEISASLQEMQAMTGQNADNAGQANNLAGDAVASADRGNEAMQRMEQAIDKIKASSDQTAKIVKTIDEIAFQTNLLALNAAVEAARAGDAGKGFAVVAEEVRSLAQRSAEAAKNTAELIDGAVKNAEGGVTISSEVRTILTDIVEGSKKVNDLIAEIASASKEQAHGIKQITEGVTSMDKVTQENSANSEQSAAAATQLNEQAKALNEMILRFNLGQSGQASGLSQVAPAPAAPQPRTVRSHSAAAVKAEQVIPLDDDDLATF